MSFSVFEKIDPSCQNGSMEKTKNIPYHQRPYASIAERTLVDISIYSPRPQIAGTGHSHSKISIHSPRAGRDCRYPNAPLITQISIHSPHTGRDRLVNAPIVSPSLFQSTLPAWGETRSGGRRPPCRYNFNPLSPHGERQNIGYLTGGQTHFNPLSPHGERPLVQSRMTKHDAFQSTLPAWGETRLRPHQRLRQYHFNPLSPHGERRGKAEKFFRGPSFQSTLPAWGETVIIRLPSASVVFQSTLPAWGETGWIAAGPCLRSNFNPLSPHGERQEMC